MSIVMMAFVYPIVTILLYVLDPLTTQWAVWQQTLLLTPATVVLIVFVISPLVATHFDGFARPRLRS
ncbi:hypothetical protein VDS18_11385 [Xanthomonas campestris pv. campestris]|nr:hypothetical protein [Xanthomonas campestris pv. campestris]